MKNPFLQIFIIVFLFSCFVVVNEKKGIARVTVITGKEVYVLSEPLRDYEVVERLNNKLTNMTVGRQTIDDQVQSVIKRGIKREEKGEINFDAVLTSNGTEMLLLKFKD